MIAFTRSVPASFADALAAVPSVLDVARARAQHAAYRAALADFGLSVVQLPVADALADSCFVEDTAIVAAGIALITRPGAPSRRGETGAVAEALAAHMEIVHMEDPATLDGGDCMRVGATIYVGRSLRTNSAGIARLTSVFSPRGVRIVPVDLPAGVLHLKCVCTALGEDRIVLADETIPRSVFAGVDVVSIPASEAYAANVVVHGRRALVAAGFPRTCDTLTSVGLEPSTVDTSEFRKADGSLTCLSILV